jgi:hypothetical protein
MAQTNRKVPVEIEKTPASAQARRPFERFRREMDRLFEDFFGPPFAVPSLVVEHRTVPATETVLDAIPAVNVTETDKEGGESARKFVGSSPASSCGRTISFGLQLARKPVRFKKAIRGRFARNLKAISGEGPPTNLGVRSSHLFGRANKIKSLRHIPRQTCFPEVSSGKRMGSSGAPDHLSSVAHRSRHTIFYPKNTSPAILSVAGFRTPQHRNCFSSIAESLLFA